MEFLCCAFVTEDAPGGLDESEELDQRDKKSEPGGNDGDCKHVDMYAFIGISIYSERRDGTRWVITKKEIH